MSGTNIQQTFDRGSSEDGNDGRVPVVDPYGMKAQLTHTESMGQQIVPMPEDMLTKSQTKSRGSIHSRMKKSGNAYSQIVLRAGSRRSIGRSTNTAAAGRALIMSKGL